MKVLDVIKDIIFWRNKQDANAKLFRMVWWFSAYKMVVNVGKTKFTFQTKGTKINIQYARFYNDNNQIRMTLTSLLNLNMCKMITKNKTVQHTNC